MLDILNGIWSVIWGLLTLINWPTVAAAVIVVYASKAGWWQFKKLDNWLDKRFPEKDGS